jgi:hypothetical protein
MKTLSLVFAAVFLLSTTSFSQEKTNDQIDRQIRSSGVDHINVTFDAPSNTSKLMAVAENFSNHDADSAGVQAINFAMGFFYPGTSLKASPETIHFSFWVLTKKPRFAESHHLTVDVDGRTLDLGDARYAAKSNQNLEYLNFDIPRSDLAAIGSASKVTFHIGPGTFTATVAQLKLIRSTTQIADVTNGI